MKCRRAVENQARLQCRARRRKTDRGGTRSDLLRRRHPPNDVLPIALSIAARTQTASAVCEGAVRLARVLVQWFTPAASFSLAVLARNDAVILRRYKTGHGENGQNSPWIRAVSQADN